MTVTNSIGHSDLFSGNGATTAFPTRFQFQKNADVEVILIDAGVEHIQVENTNYTLTGANNPLGGTVTFRIAPAVGQKVRMKRRIPFTQETHYTEGTAFPAATHEDALDRGVMLSQDLRAEIERSPRLKFSSPLYPLEFPDGGAANRGNLIRWNTVDGTTLEAVSPISAALTSVLNPVNGGFVAGDGAKFVVKQGATARASLGLGSMATQSFSNVAVTGGSISNTTTTLKDSDFTIQANSDATKQVKLNAASITAGNTRILTVPNKNGTIAVTSDINNAPLTTKGDILTYNTDLARLPVGLDGQILTADSTTNTGVKWFTPSGSGDISGPVSSRDGEVALFSGTTGRLIKRAIKTGIAKLTSGVLGTATAGTDYYAPDSTDVSVADGGTGRSDAKAYSLLCGGTTTTAPLQYVTSVGTAGQVLKSNGIGALPSFQTITESGMTLLSSLTASNSSSVSFANFFSSHRTYMITIDNFSPATNSTVLHLHTSSDGGTSYDTGSSDYGITMISIRGGASGPTSSSSNALPQIRLNDISNCPMSNTASHIGIVYIFFPSGAGNTNFQWQFGGMTASSNVSYNTGGGRRYQSAAVDGIRFSVSSGAIATGRFKLYGIGAL